MKRGEVWWVNFFGSQGGEIQKERPAIIISNDSSNKFLNRVQVIPLSTQTGKVYPCEALVKVKNKIHKAMADQIATVSKTRLSNKAGTVASSDLKNVETAIRLQLGLP